jgi:hypothetical protein
MEYEGRRCLWRAAAGAACLASIPVLAVGGFVAGAYLVGDLHRVALVVLGAVVALVLGQLDAAYIWRRRPWDQLILSRLWTYEQVEGAQDLNTIIRRRDFERACRALRRARLNPVGCARVPQPPADALDLDTKLIIARSAYWHEPNAPEIFVQVADCLAVARIRARVAGKDIESSRPAAGG